jgi:NADH:ubiquinone oxidoreductase subunit 5 (subunit L)/multisubunit Na+/H+ antiporter MnhA subunit
MNIDSLGGLIKRIPKTAYLFLMASLAICGLPPFNGFVSEFIIYFGLFSGLPSNHFWFILFMLMAILSLVVIGGLALLCFTKAFGIVFLGTPRSNTPNTDQKERNVNLIPLYAIAVMMVLIGVFPRLFAFPLFKVIGLFSAIDSAVSLRLDSWLELLTTIGRSAILLIFISLVIFAVRYWLLKKRQASLYHTWGCGYVGDASKMQYTASSYIRSYRKLAEPMLLVSKDKVSAKSLYPEKVHHHTHAYDKLESILIDKPLFLLRRFLNRFVFLQNGKIQAYLLYGLLFVTIAVILPAVVAFIIQLFNFFNQL